LASGKERLPGVGEPHRPVVAVEEPDAEEALQVRDLLAHRGLRDVQALGRTPEVPLLRHDHERPDPSQLH